MFENLMKGIMIENLDKIKQNHKKFRYASEKKENETKDNVQEDSLSDLGIEIEEREESFKRMFAKNELDDESSLIKTDYSTPPKLKKITHELELSQQKLKLQENSHKREIDFLKQVHERRQQWLNTQIDRLKIINQRYKQENGRLKNTKNEVFSLNELKDVLQKRLEQKEEENYELHQEIKRMKRNYEIRIQKYQQNLLEANKKIMQLIGNQYSCKDEIKRNRINSYTERK